MDTPFKPDGNKKRKLKKVLKKKPVNLHSSLTSSTSYQKKVKNAINVSLNSTRNVRTLQTNNRCLANGLAKWKQECRLSQDRCNYLLEANHELRERILELERGALTSPKFTRNEIEIQHKLKLRKIEDEVKKLFSHAQDFVTNLQNLMESFIPSEENSLLDLSGRLCCQKLNEEYDNIGTLFKKNKLQDLSLIAENSILFQSLDAQTIEEKKVDRKAEMKLPTKLPVRVPVQNENNAARVKKKKSLSPSKSPAMSPFYISQNESPLKSKCKSISKETGATKPKQFKYSPTKKYASDTKHKPKKPTSPKKDNPIIINEFALVNRHLELMKKVQGGELPESDKKNSSFPTNQDKTSLSVLDMDLTSIDSLSSVNIAQETKLDDNLPVMAESYGTDPVVDEFLWADQKCPEAVTLRRGKPGQFSFAASRKHSDGTRKTLTADIPPKSRSRKKTVPERLSISSPQSIFDFHEKTPKAFYETKSKDIILNKPGELSATSPVCKYKQSQPDVENILKPTFLLLSDEPEFQLPLKDSPNNQSIASQARRTRSQSRIKKAEREKEDNLLQVRSQEQMIMAVVTPSEIIGDVKSCMKPSSKSPKKLLQMETDVTLRRQTFSVSKDSKEAGELIVVKSKSDFMTGQSSEHSLLSDEYSQMASTKSKSGKQKKTEDLDEKSNISTQCKTMSRSSRTVSLGLQKGKVLVKELKENMAMKVKEHSDDAILANVQGNNSYCNNNNQLKDVVIPCDDSDNQATVIAIHECTQNLDDLWQKASTECSQENAEMANNHLDPPIEKDNTQVSLSNTNTHPHKPESDETIAEAYPSDCGAITSKRTSNKGKTSKFKSKKLLNAEESDGDLNTSLDKKSRSMSERSKHKKNSVHQNQLEEQYNFHVPSFELSEKQNDTKCIATSGINERPTGETEPKSVHKKKRDSFEVATSQLLRKVKHLKTPKLKTMEESDLVYLSKENIKTSTSVDEKNKLLQRSTSPTVNKKKRKKSMSPCKAQPTLSSIDADPLKEEVTIKSQVYTVQPASQEPISSDMPEVKKRRAATKVPNYTEFSLKSKLRRGDPIASHYCTSENIMIFKEKVKGNKSKKDHKSVLTSLHNQSIQEEN